MLGLMESDINWETGEVTINKSRAYVRGKGSIDKETKTLNSDRKLFISSVTLDILRKYIEEKEKLKDLLGTKWIPTSRLFTTDFGGEMHLDTPANILDRIQKKYNLRHLKWHGLRHTSISLMIREGIQAQVISKKSGHSSLQVLHRNV